MQHILQATAPSSSIESKNQGSPSAQPLAPFTRHVFGMLVEARSRITRFLLGKRPVNPILKLGKRMPEVGAWKKRQLEECGYDVVGKR